MASLINISPAEPQFCNNKNIITSNIFYCDEWYQLYVRNQKDCSIDNVTKLFANIKDMARNVFEIAFLDSN